MTIQYKALIVTATVATITAVSVAGVHAVTINTKGKVHGPQTLTTTYQKADQIVITSNPQPQGDTSDMLQPAISPVK